MQTTIDHTRQATAVTAAEATWPRRWVLFGALVVLNGFDVVTTRIGLDRGAIETNPLMRSAVENLWSAVAMKLLLLGVALMIVATMPRLSRRVEHVLALSVLWYVVVVSWNLHVISQQVA